MKILVVDDEQTLLDQLKSALETRRYMVENALDREEALDKLIDNPVDLIILDIMLPKLDGLSVLREVRRMRITTPVLMLTAKGDIEDKIKGLDLGADDYPAKPFSLDDLPARVRLIQAVRGAGGFRAADQGSAAGYRQSRSKQGRRTGGKQSEIPKVFEQFYRVEKSRSMRHGGSGLGLAIVKRVVELHGGKVEFESRQKGWTRVTVSLPRHQEKKSA